VARFLYVRSAVSCLKLAIHLFHRQNHVSDFLVEEIPQRILETWQCLQVPLLPVAAFHHCTWATWQIVVDAAENSLSLTYIVVRRISYNCKGVSVTEVASTRKQGCSIFCLQKPLSLGRSAQCALPNLFHQNLFFKYWGLPQARTLLCRGACTIVNFN
jgi:hypothetical protein